MSLASSPSTTGRTFRDWTAYLLQQPALGVEEAIALTRPLLDDWDLFTTYRWGDGCITALVNRYPDPAWRALCAEYIVPCLDDLRDHLNEVSVLTRYHQLLETISPHWLEQPSRSLYIQRWQDLARGDVPPQTETEHWAALLLGEHSDLAFGDKLYSMLQTGAALLSGALPYIRHVCARVANHPLFIEDGLGFPLLGKHLARVAFSAWNPVPTQHAGIQSTEDDYAALLQDAEQQPLLRCYCLGLASPGCYDELFKDRRQLCNPRIDTFIKNNLAWVPQHADMVLDAFLEEDASMRATFGRDITAVLWFELWLQSQERAKDEAHYRPMRCLRDEKEVLWWLKPAWRQHQSALEILSLDFTEAITQCRSLDAQNNTPATSLPSTLSW